MPVKLPRRMFPFEVFDPQVLLVVTDPFFPPFYDDFFVNSIGQFQIYSRLRLENLPEINYSDCFFPTLLFDARGIYFESARFFFYACPRQILWRSSFLLP